MNIGIIGLGLMGGSFARVCKKFGHVVYAFDKSRDVMKKGELLNAYDFVLTEKNADKLDLLVAAVFPDAFSSATERFLPYLKKGTVVSDFCGTKRRVTGVMKEFSLKRPDLSFIGMHPMAGREYSGIEHSSINLFDRASMIFVPVSADIAALDKMKKFFLALGFGKVVICSAEEHDAVIAYTSQLCHIVSNAFVKNESAEKHDGFSAGSYRDLTRVSRLDPVMWSQLMIENKDNLTAELDELITNLNDYLAALKCCDQEKLEDLLRVGNDRKIAIDVSKNK